MKSPQPPMTIRIEVRIEQEPRFGQALRLDQEFQIPAASFLELAQILGRFEELAQRIRNERPERSEL